jgi:hypothetical protein
MVASHHPAEPIMSNRYLYPESANLLSSVSNVVHSHGELSAYGKRMPPARQLRYAANIVADGMTAANELLAFKSGLDAEFPSLAEEINLVASKAQQLIVDFEGRGFDDSQGAADNAFLDQCAELANGIQHLFHRLWIPVLSDRGMKNLLDRMESASAGVLGAEGVLNDPEFAADPINKAEALALKNQSAVRLAKHTSEFIAELVKRRHATQNFQYPFEPFDEYPAHGQPEALSN